MKLLGWIVDPQFLKRKYIYCHYDGDFMAHTAVTDFYRHVYCVIGLPIDAVTVMQAKDKLEESASAGKKCFISTPNLNFVIGSLTDPAFRDSILRSDIAVADGMPLVWIARTMGFPLPERVAGSTLFEHISESESALSVYFFGGPDGAASQAAAAVNSKGNSMKCVGYQSPGFGTVEELSKDEIIQDINEARPDFLVVALGAKKGQVWIERNLERVNANLVSHLGAVVNMVSGNISRAPIWVQKAGMEWLWRIKQEPILWKRYLNDGFHFVKILTSRVIPGLLVQKIVKHGANSLSEPKIDAEFLKYANKITLEGPWCESNLDPLRKCLSEVTGQARDIIVDVHEVDLVDSAFIGLLALLYGHQLKVGRSLRLVGAMSPVVDIFKAHCADYLLKKTSGEMN